MRPRSLFDSCESWRGESYSELWIFEFAYIYFTFGWIQLNCLIGARPWNLFVREFSLNSVNSFGSYRVGGGSLGRLFILILNK